MERIFILKKYAQSQEILDKLDAAWKELRTSIGRNPSMKEISNKSGVNYQTTVAIFHKNKQFADSHPVSSGNVNRGLSSRQNTAAIIHSSYSRLSNILGELPSIMEIVKDSGLNYSSVARAFEDRSFLDTHPLRTTTDTTKKKLAEAYKRFSSREGLPPTKTQIERESGISHVTIMSAYNDAEFAQKYPLSGGWDLRTQKVLDKLNVDYEELLSTKGEEPSRKEWSEKSGVSPSAINQVFRRHPDFADSHPLSSGNKLRWQKENTETAIKIHIAYEKFFAREKKEPTLSELAGESRMTNTPIITAFKDKAFADAHPLMVGQGGGREKDISPTIFYRGKSSYAHEPIILDIFKMNGEEVVHQPEPIKIEEQSVFRREMKPDFLVNGVYFEVFGGSPAAKEKEKYETRKQYKIQHIQNLYYVENLPRPITKVSPQHRTLQSYAQILDRDVKPDPSTKPYKDAEKTLLERMPLLKKYGITMCAHYLQVMAQLSDQQKASARSDIETFNRKQAPQLKLHAQVLQMPQQNINPPTLQQIEANLKQQYKSVDFWSNEEKVAVFFKTPQNIQKYISAAKEMINMPHQEKRVASKTIWKLI